MTATLTPAPQAPAAPNTSAEPVDAIDDAERSRRIRVAVRAKSKELKATYPILQHQDAIGASILATTVAIVIATGVAYAAGLLAWWLVIPIAAFAMSIAHEIEHDAIHRMYFTRSKKAQSVIFAIVWALRPYTVSPWVRRELHLLHHKVSGTDEDLEERSITNGFAWSPLRLIGTFDPIAAAHLNMPADLAGKKERVIWGAKSYFPLMFVAATIWYAFVGIQVAGLFGLELTGSLVGLVSFLTVTWIGPNVFRVACLHFVSSNMHYFGDVEKGNVVQQTQVLNPWWLLPAQAFCFNFGSTHAIHHFVPGDPFYIRQMIAKTAHPVMRDNGVRFNDFGTFRRANRFSMDQAA